MSEITNAIKQICEEKGLSYEAVVVTIESALAAAYRKDFGKKNQNIKVEFDPETSKSKVYDIKTVVENLPEEELIEAAEVKETVPVKTNGEKVKKVKAKKDKDKKDETKKEIEPTTVSENEEMVEEEEKRFNPKTDIQLKDAKVLKKTAKIGDEIKTRLEVPEEYGRMAAQTAKQVIIQRLREAEREMIYNEFKSKEKEVVSGVIQRREGRIVLIDLGKTVGILPADEQIPSEQYRSGERVKVFVKEVNARARGAEVILSRTSDEILKKVFYLEIPEISNGLIDIKAVAREAGYRSKVAVWTDSENVDPIGSCVGQRGARIQTIIGELGGEKIDIILYDEDPTKFIVNALSPAKIIDIELDEAEKKALVIVSPDQLSLAIGKGGQNARLAAKLTGWKIDIAEAKSKDEIKEEKKDKELEKEKEKVADENKDESEAQKTEAEVKENDETSETEKSVN